MKDKQRKNFFAMLRKGDVGISSKIMKKSNPEETRIKIRPSTFVQKIAKEKKITDTVGINVGIVHYAHSEERIVTE